MDRAMFHADNAYDIPNVRIAGYLCKTNLPSNTAFRGFGGPQAQLVCETWIEGIAKQLGLSPNEVSWHDDIFWTQEASWMFIIIVVVIVIVVVIIIIQRSLPKHHLTTMRR